MTMSRVKVGVGVAGIVAALALLVSGAGAQELGLGFEGVRFWNGIVPSGLDLSLTYGDLGVLEGGDAFLYLKAGGGYENASLVRDPLTGDPSSLVGGYEYDMLDFQWELAFVQGLSRRDDGDNLLEVFLFYRGRYDDYLNELSTVVFPDAGTLFGTSVMAGVSYDSRVLDRHRSRSGVYAEATAEWGPGFLNAVTDFWRVSAQARGFLPVYDTPTDGGNLFNVYLAGFAGIDYAGGDQVPIYVNQSFGGRDLRDSLGNVVRGYGWNKYDTSLKAVANAEVRLVGPAIVLDSVVPYLFAFGDVGYYAGFPDATVKADASGVLASVGGGVALDLVGFAQAGIIAGVRLVEDDVGYTYDPEAFFWGIKFFLHF